MAASETKNIQKQEKGKKGKTMDKAMLHATLNMAWPAIVESFFVAFAGLVDSLMVSALGPEAVAAVGLTVQPKFVGLSLFVALNVAISALVARRRGEGRQKEANGILYTAVVFILISAIVLSILFVVLAGPLIALCGSTPETHDSAVLYFQIIMGGMIFNCIQIGINSAQRGAGNTKITMRTNLTSNIINIFLNYLLIEGHLGFPALGIRGAALATVLGTVVACIMSIISILNPKGFVSIPYIIKNKIKPTFSAFTHLVRMGYSVFLEQLLMRIGFMLTAIMAARQGNDAMAAHQVGMNIMALTFSFGDGLQATAVALIGRSLGEGNQERAKEYGRICKILGGLISICLAVLYFIGARPLFSLFFKEEAIISIGVDIMYVIILVVVFQIRQVIYMGCLRGAGDTLYTAIASAISVTIIRTALSYLCGYALGWGIVGIWLGVLGDQVSRYIFASIRFKAGKWTEIKI
ncbi:MAG: MATE family efflux transporter [Bacteroides sp.]|nr:MATE family efflux transporter [Bacteroides sp.]MCM1550458.1 MATE family efflux transporter [Clostridium sp.]